jgi:hypothetical protein
MFITVYKVIPLMSILRKSSSQSIPDRSMVHGTSIQTQSSSVYLNKESYLWFFPYKGTTNNFLLWFEVFMLNEKKIIHIHVYLSNVCTSIQTHSSVWPVIFTLSQVRQVDSWVCIYIGTIHLSEINLIGRRLVKITSTVSQRKLLVVPL